MVALQIQLYKYIPTRTIKVGVWGSRFYIKVPIKISPGKEKQNLLGMYVLNFVLFSTFAAVLPKVEYQQVLGTYGTTTSECVRYTCSIAYDI